MNCRTCGEQVANVGELSRHKKVCKGNVKEGQGEPTGKVIIPYHLFGDEADLISIYRTGGIMYIRVEGVKRAEGVEVTHAWLQS